MSHSRKELEQQCVIGIKLGVTFVLAIELAVTLIIFMWREILK